MRQILQAGTGKTEEELFYRQKGKIIGFEDGFSKIYYSSPACYSALDDLQYMMRNHVSDDDKEDFSILKKHNYTGKYTLQSMSSIFAKAYEKGEGQDKAGIYNIERITITGNKNTFEDHKSADKSPSSISSFNEKSEALSFKFFNTPANIINEKLITKIITQYDRGDKQFSVFQSQGNIQNVKENFNDNYVSMLKGYEKPSPNMILTDTKKNNIISISFI
jgi:hypothetical protein